MEELSNSPGTPGVGEAEATTGTQVTEQSATVNRKDYLELQSEYTVTRQNQIALAKELVALDPSKLDSLPDRKIRNAVVKELMGYDSYDDMLAVEGHDYANKLKSGDEGVDRLGSLEKQLRKLTYEKEKAELERAINKAVEENKDHFRDESSINMLRETVKLISSTVPVEERVRLAAAPVMVNSVYDKRTALYREQATATAGSTMSPGGEDKNKSQADKKVESLKSYFKTAKTF